MRVILARPRLFLSALAGVVIYFLLPSSQMPHAITRALVAFNTSGIAYLLLALEMMAHSTHENMRSRAKTQDEGRYTILALVALCSLTALAGTAIEMSMAKDLQGAQKAGHVVLAGLSVFTAWCVNQTMFALHYAHDYYIKPGREHKGLMFPGGGHPDYFDFLYASAIVGTSGQTADVSFDTSAMRRLAMVHSVLSFFFNTIVLALTINIAAGLL